MHLDGLPDRLRAARAASDFTQKQISEKLGYIQKTIANWERGRTEPCAYDLAQLACLYSVSADWLLTGSPRLPHRFGTAVPVCAQRCIACE